MSKQPKPYDGPNKLAVDSERTALGRAVAKVLSWQGVTLKLESIGESLSPTPPAVYDERARALADKYKQHSGMTGSLPIVPPSAEVAAMSTQEYYDPTQLTHGVSPKILREERTQAAEQIDLRNNRGLQGPQ